MKKSLLAVAVAAALPTFAQAQSSVTLFGILDASVEYSNDEANSAYGAANTGTLTRGDDTLRLNSGTQSGSRFGVRGTEDLGGGLRAIFTIEHRLNVDTGNTAGGGFNSGNGTFWNGQAWVGLSGGWGQLTAGRQYSPIFWALIPADFTGYGFYNNWAGFSGTGFGVSPQGPIRLDNSLAYKSPTWGGLTVYATYAFGELTNSLATNGAGGASGDIMGIAAGWQLGGLYLAAGYHSIDTNAAGGLETVLAAAASYKFSSFGVSLGYTQQDFVGGADASVILGSAFLNIGPGTLFLNASMIDNSGFAGLKNDSALQLGLAYSMPLSKRTNWYVAYGMNDLSGFQPTASNVALDGIMRLSVGLRHLF